MVLSNYPKELLKLDSLEHLVLQEVGDDFDWEDFFLNKIIHYKQLKHLGIGPYHEVYIPNKACQTLEYLERLDLPLVNVMCLPDRRFGLPNERYLCLPDNIGSMKSLRYLNLGMTEIAWFPPSLFELEALDTLWLPDPMINDSVEIKKKFKQDIVLLY